MDLNKLFNKVFKKKNEKFLNDFDDEADKDFTLIIVLVIIFLVLYLFIVIKSILLALRCNYGDDSTRSVELTLMIICALFFPLVNLVYICYKPFECDRKPKFGERGRGRGRGRGRSMRRRRIDVRR